ncbi:uncharacterized protein Z518_03108 [Rhinocladiella mackenziei CBS 650.93]|uniref:Sensitive to high expression protein 9, mitochondrial n=1 Tax=Rhinocladiella mackenziei CBS 650.93 TaxID=1442369 RepID=A0A0D2G1S9_9EURO|nr:uncharacterized protein Z518_03108 [Rhinocladiella mackenziei CBS 650.93]KIX08452.1 hypothetical protein Z518_03108 [Rhinocladiella mackenziei CBS 650.93]
MQQAPLRLSQTLWSAFRAAKPLHKSLPRPHQFPSLVPSSPQIWTRQRPQIAFQARFYSESKSEIDRKAEDAESRIEESLEAHPEAAAQAKQPKDPQDGTTVHTIPEASSVFHSSRIEENKNPWSEIPHDKPLPSDSSSRYSNLRNRFTDFMDNFQTHIFTASRRLNDLTGYSGIEALKNEIEHQESIVQESRRAVKDARNKYTEAIATRSTTQREVNDLLHRKHTWTPTDLERFTSLYRSDHANEQAEAAAQREVADAEARYEEASTKLAKAILARYHEEQIWSDKIRQMSTWGTWGLMGINVLLFVIFQIAIEPWRRKRLVKGFEEKVELALKERDEDRMAASTVQPNQSTAAAAMSTGEKVGAVADNIVGQIVDAVSGTTTSDDTPPGAPSSIPPQAIIGTAAENMAAKELAAEEMGRGSPDIPILPSDSSHRWTSPSSALAWYEDALGALFSGEQKILVSQRELTTIAMEGVAGGMALMGLLFVLLRPR